MQKQVTTQDEQGQTQETWEAAPGVQRPEGKAPTKKQQKAHKEAIEIKETRDIIRIMEQDQEGEGTPPPPEKTRSPHQGRTTPQ